MVGLEHAVRTLFEDGENLAELDRRRVDDEDLRDASGARCRNLRAG